jgi:hypothetical protein
LGRRQARGVLLDAEADEKKGASVSGTPAFERGTTTSMALVVAAR